jgi:hypothetical protein
MGDPFAYFPISEAVNLIWEVAAMGAGSQKASLDPTIQMDQSTVSGTSLVLRTRLRPALLAAYKI